MANKKWYPWVLLVIWVAVMAIAFTNGGPRATGRSLIPFVKNQSCPPRGHVRIIELRGTHKTVNDVPTR